MGNVKILTTEVRNRGIVKDITITEDEKPERGYKPALDTFDGKKFLRTIEFPNFKKKGNIWITRVNKFPVDIPFDESDRGWFYNRANREEVDAMKLERG